MIFKQELIKIFRNPVIPLLFVFFIGINFLIINSRSYVKEELSILTDLVAQYGTHIDEEMKSQIEKDYVGMVAWVNDLAPDQNKLYEHPSQLLADISNSGVNPLSNEDFQQLQRYSVVEYYVHGVQEIDEVYEGLNFSELAQSLIDLYGLTGSAAEEFRDGYQKLENRTDELVSTGEHTNLFFMGKMYGMHSLFFKDIGRALIYELMILVVLITAFITNYEFEHRTSLIAYTTKRGRKLVLDKLVAAIGGTMVVMAGLIGITLSMFFFTYDYSVLWNVPISSYFNAEAKLPYISWWNVSFLEYLALFVLFTILIQLLFSGVSFFLSVLLKNTYLVFFVFVIFLGIGFIIPGYMPRDSILIFLMNFNPSVLILNPQEWLMGNGPFTMHPYYEVITIGGWGAAVGVLGGISIIHFKKESL